MSYPTTTKDTDAVYKSLRHFGGRKPARFMVRLGSDRAPEIIKACEQLGWIHDLPPANTKIHNPIAERGIRTSKEGTACNLQQAGFAEKEWPTAQEHHDVAKMFTESAPADGLDDVRFGKTKFEVATGTKFTGKLLPYGCLMW
jgi:hypothetical protein